MMYEYVRVEKIFVSDQPVAATGCSATYRYGEGCPGVSLPVGYGLEGWLVGKLVVGNPAIIFRQVRNGVETLGFFTSTPVTEVRSENEFCTRNSVYRLTHINASVWPRRRNLPEAEQALFSRWLFNSTVPVVHGTPADEQDYFYPWDYVEWHFWCIEQQASN